LTLQSVDGYENSTGRKKRTQTFFTEITMDILIDMETKSGQKLYKKITGVEKVIVFDDVKARIQVDSDCCVRTPVRPKDVERYVEED
jgi:hypothetical protein